MKRLFDIVIILMFLPFIVATCIAIFLLVWANLGSPALFKQNRPGKNGKIFSMIKFRTMTDRRDKDGVLLPDRIRLTKFGKFLRSTSLDELPEFWNIVKGDMSLVGPRPLLVEYLSLYSATQARRHEVKPGITGWAQINGRNAIDWEERFDLDVWYVDNRTFWLDIKILWLTLNKVLAKSDISQAGHATMQKFKGNSNVK